MDQIKRPQLVSGEFQFLEMFEQCPNEILKEARDNGGNVMFDVVRVAEFDPTPFHPQLIESFATPTNFRVVKPRGI